MYDLRTRTSGTRNFAQFHIAVAPEMSVRDAHRLVEAIETRLHGAFPDTEILIHLNPEGQIDQPDNPLVEADIIAEAAPNA